MKILPRQAFLALPADTVFSTYEPCVFGPIAVKGDTIYADDGRAIDFFYQAIEDAWAGPDGGDYDHLLRTAESTEVDLYCQTREGLFDDSMLYAVWEAADVAALVARLSQCL